MPVRLPLQVCLAWSSLALLPALAFSQAAAIPNKAPAEQIEFFEKHIRPVLVTHCYECHSQESEGIQGGLTLDTREGIRSGGDLGPAVVPGNVRKSLLMQAIGYQDDDLQMPPDEKLPAEVIARFERWIELGAADPREGTAPVAREEIDIEAGRQFWAFQPPEKVAPPEVSNSAWPRTDLDRFLLARLEAEGLHPVADAAPHALLRRLYFDLIGLPPSPADVEAFTADYARDSQAAVAKVTEKLLASPRFGERWARHWLDVARYAESSGRAANIAYPHAWRYRDWVIAAFNSDMPYDQFISRQLAGDLLPATDAQERADNLVATGFLAIGPKAHNERNRRQFALDLADEQLDATFQAFQGLTVACARCHDHKFDPIPQADYYAVAGIFLNTDTQYGTSRGLQNANPSDLIELPVEAKAAVGIEPLSAASRRAIERQIEQLRERLNGPSEGAERVQFAIVRARIALLNEHLDQYDENGTPRALAMGADDKRFTFDSRVYIRGELDQPGDRVRRGFPQVLTDEQPTIRRGSGRLELARWISSTENPLTARVMVNRVWQHLIGRPLVGTPDNFGAAGQEPSHAELLDHLAVSFMEDRWSVKQLIRQIVSSRAYQLSADYHAANYQHDPDNVYVWRMPNRRLEAEALRDTMLLLGGRLELEPPAGSDVSRNDQPTAVILMRGDPSTFNTQRSVYLPIVRDQLPDMLTLFDFPDPSLIAGQRSSTTIPGQSLFLMNNIFVMHVAHGLANSLDSDSQATGDGQLTDEAQTDKITRAYLLCFSRNPTDSEINAALGFLDQYEQEHSARAAWAAFCQALMASAEFSQR